VIAHYKAERGEEETRAMNIQEEKNRRAYPIVSSHKQELRSRGEDRKL
jgi:hypothetical protein